VLPTHVSAIYQRERKHHLAVPTDRRVKREIQLTDLGGLNLHPGDLIRVELLPTPAAGRYHRGKALAKIGLSDDPWAISLISLNNHSIPQDFTAEALADADTAGAVPLAGREDLRALPLVTIDGIDARDFDDAVFAEPDPDPQNPGGWHLIVAIADVAFYVREHSPLDLVARERGNSVYMPDRVVPMLPEILSNHWCSLKPDEDRGCLAVHIWLDRAGEKIRHRFVRAVMRSAARLTYEQVQETITTNLPHPFITPLHQVYGKLRKIRETRGALELTSVEMKLRFNDAHQVESFHPAPHFAAHEVIEEFMILANVCAAETLSEKAFPALYRIHPEPEDERVETLQTILRGIGQGIDLKQGVTPFTFNRALVQARGKPFERFINQAVLLTQAQASYHPDNIGHFGLGLPKYAHFTSPIRRYADLIVHRALISVLGLGDGGFAERLDDDGFIKDLVELSEHLSLTERRAAKAERDAVNRFVASYYEQHIGTVYGVSIVRVFTHGLIVIFNDTQAEAFIPRELLGSDQYRLDESGHMLVGVRSRVMFTLGDVLEAEVWRVDVVTGSVVLKVRRIVQSHRQAPRPLGEKQAKKGKGDGPHTDKPGTGKTAKEKAKIKRKKQRRKETIRQRKAAAVTGAEATAKA
jgi:ribonuclease R